MTRPTKSLEQDETGGFLMNSAASPSQHESGLWNLVSTPSGSLNAVSDGEDIEGFHDV